jgi:hypothetical protein
VVFDISTNKAGFDDEFNCTSLLTSIKGLGTEGRSCTWKGNKQFDILLGSGATLLPGETITLRASKIRNKAGYSTTLRPVAQPVLLPKLARAPEPGLLSGPREVDVCSSMVLQLDPQLGLWSTLGLLQIRNSTIFSSAIRLLLL